MAANRSAVELDLAQLVIRVSPFIEPLVRMRLERDHGTLIVAASEMLRNAKIALRGLLRIPESLREVNSELLVEDLEQHLSSAGLPPERVIRQLVADIADALVTTWLDILDQGCEENGGELQLNTETLLPSPKSNPELSLLIGEALTPTVLLEEDAHTIMRQLRGSFGSDSILRLPLDLELSLEDKAGMSLARRRA